MLGKKPSSSFIFTIIQLVLIGLAVISFVCEQNHPSTELKPYDHKKPPSTDLIVYEQKDHLAMDSIVYEQKMNQPTVIVCIQELHLRT